MLRALHLHTHLGSRPSAKAGRGYLALPHYQKSWIFCIEEKKCGEFDLISRGLASFVLTIPPQAQGVIFQLQLELEGKSKYKLVLYKINTCTNTVYIIHDTRANRLYFHALVPSQAPQAEASRNQESKHIWPC